MTEDEGRRTKKEILVSNLGFGLFSDCLWYLLTFRPRTFPKEGEEGSGQIKISISVYIQINQTLPYMLNLFVAICQCMYSFW